MNLVQCFHALGSPPHFYALAGRLIPWLAALTVLLLGAGLYLGLWVAPADYQQGESYRIIYIHVPSAWMSLFVYVTMAGASALALVWRMKLADAVAAASAPIGASFTLLALATGSLWGKPMWGAWWVWDARLTSELILFFLYLGVIALRASFADRVSAARAAGLLAVVGVINIPIIHFSVDWWNTLHQPATLTRFEAPAIHGSMLRPLLLMAVAFLTYYGCVLLARVRCELLERERRASWVKELAAG